MVAALNEIAQPIVLVGGKHIPAVRTWEESATPDSPRFIDVAESRLEPYLRWHRIPRFLAYLIWLRKARKKAREMIAAGGIDAVMHVTFSVFWLPTPATSLGLPSIWGPVGGAVTTPRRLWPLLGFVGLIQELLDYATVRLLAALPAARRTALTANVCIVQNAETRNRLPARVRDRARDLNHALLSDVPPAPSEPDGRYAMWVSLMESRKAPRLVIEALARTSNSVPLVMVGDGPQRSSLERLAAKLGISDRITFTGWIERTAAVRYMKGATTVIFTGLREEGGLALAEAMHSARRVIVLDHGGAGSIARRATDPERVALIAPDKPAAVANAIAEAVDAHFEAGPVDHEPLLDRAAALGELAAAVADAANS
jgi:glycosyltransferase involved in cell wall biosynthesis